MTQTSKLLVSRFENRTGAVSWRVSGNLNGIRLRKNFKTREEAAAEKSALEIKALQLAAGFRAAVTSLSDDQLREAESAFRRISGMPYGLSAHLDFSLAHLRTAVVSMRLAEAAPQYMSVKRQEFDRRLLSERQFRSIKYELATFCAAFSSACLSSFTPAILVRYLERGLSSLKTYNNRRGLLSTFFKYCVKQDWIEKNPVEKTPHHRIRNWRGSATTISAEKAGEIMAWVETYRGGLLVPYFALCLFAGIRPCVLGGEITRLKPESVMLETGVIHIEPSVSKVRMKRQVTIQPNLEAWLRAYPLDRYPILPAKNAQRIRRKVFTKFGLTHDVLRHTFISMFVGKFRSMGEAALQAGNSEAVIKRHYLDLKSKAESERYFSILPEKSGVLWTSSEPKDSMVKLRGEAA